MTRIRTPLALALFASACAPSPMPLGSEEESIANPPLAVQPFQGQGSPEPGIAVGKRYLYSMSSGSYEVFARDGNGVVDSTNPVVPGTSLENGALFGQIVASLSMKLQSPDFPGSSSTHMCPETTFQSDSNVSWSDVGCLGAPYDSDVIYDPVRDRFWIMAHLRNFIYPCDDGVHNDDPHWYTTQWDINNNQSTASCTTKAQITCHEDPTGQIGPKRFIAVAVTKPGTDPENPANGYNVHVLVDEDGDWPQMMVHGDYLLLDTRSPKTENTVHVFNATRLANLANTVMTEKEFSIDLSTVTQAWDWSQSALVSFTPTTPIFFVKQPYAPDDPTYFVAGGKVPGGKGTQLVFYALQPLGGPSSPPMPVPTIVDVHSTVPFDIKFENQGNFVPGAFQNGEFYWAWPAAQNDDYTDNHIFIQALRVPLSVETVAGFSTVKATNLASDGFLSITAGETDTAHEYALPIVGVNANNDWTVEFSRFNKKSSPLLFPDVRYLVMYHGQNTFNGSAEIMQGNFFPQEEVNGYLCTGNFLTPGDGGRIDTPSVVADPLSPTMLWMSYGVPNSNWSNALNHYQAVISAIDIGPCANNSQATDRFRIGLMGCGGSEIFSNKAQLCSGGYHICSVGEWSQFISGSPLRLPTADYWTANDPLDLYETASTCAAVTSGGWPCGDKPMHVCTSGTDAFNNTCPQPINCGYNLSGNEYFGGCGASTAGTLCCADVSP